MKLLINTEDKTITVKESFLLYDLLVEVDKLNIDLNEYKITIEPQVLKNTEYIYLPTFQNPYWYSYPIYEYKYTSGIDVINPSGLETTTGSTKVTGSNSITTTGTAAQNNMASPTPKSYYTLENSGMGITPTMQDIFESLVKDMG